MDLIAGYGGDDEPAPEPTPGVEIDGAEAKQTPDAAPVLTVDIPADMLAGFDDIRSKMMVNLAPVVKEKENTSSLVIDPRKSFVYHNPKVEELYAPSSGPMRPGARAKVAPGQLNTVTGFVENDSLSDEVFKQQFVQFNTKGFALDPSQSNYAYGAYVMQTGAQRNAEDTEAPQKKRNKKKSEKSTQDASNVDEFRGPWAMAGQERELSGPAAAEEGETAPTDENADQSNHSDNEDVTPAAKRQRRNKEPAAEVGGVFHGSAMRDSLGRSWLEPPAGVKDKQDKRFSRVRGEEISSDVIRMMQAGSDGDLSGKDVAKKWKPASDVTCYLPKKVIHEFKGHQGPVWKSTFSPRYGHLMMSCSTDKTIKIWDYYNQKKCLMTYYGHNGAVRDVCFSSDGTKFTSASFDRDVRLWDTETGKCLGTFTNGSIPNVVRIHPTSDMEFLVGTSNKRVLQWDARENKIAQEYDRHLGAVNTITYVDDARRFVTTSDDKTILVWEWGIAVDIKRIADPSMNSMPAVGEHPNHKWLLMQSLDNNILVYSAKDKFRMNNRKVFKGHTNAGFAIQPNMSPDGRYVISGDHEGRLWIWDWKTTQKVAVKQAHEKVLMFSEWHPHESSRVVTSSWDGSIKLWD